MKNFFKISYFLSKIWCIELTRFWKKGFWVVVAMRQYQPIFPNSLHEFYVNIGGSLFIMFQLDLYERWIVHIRLNLSAENFDVLFSEIV